MTLHKPAGHHNLSAVDHGSRVFHRSRSRSWGARWTSHATSGACLVRDEKVGPHDPQHMRNRVAVGTLGVRGTDMSSSSHPMVRAM